MLAKTRGQGPEAVKEPHNVMGNVTLLLFCFALSNNERTSLLLKGDTIPWSLRYRSSSLVLNGEMSENRKVSVLISKENKHYKTIFLKQDPYP